jgi:pimeloyl-ACP methyl ester carboxylesterase
VVALTTTITATVTLAVLTGWWTPRGPVTPAQALWAITTSLGLGVFAGLLTRSRWAMLAVPALFATTFELVRSGTDGPLVDGLHLSEYGVLAFVTGRGFHAVVTLLPMVLGVAVGVGLRRRGDHMSGPRRPRARAGRWIRRGVAAATAVALGVLAFAVASPGTTAAITDAAGRPLTGSIAELTRGRVGGHNLSMMIRGDSTTLPVLLVLAGGPGGTERGAMRHHGQLLEHHFVVVTWDQRGTGGSYDQLDPTSSLTLDDAISETLELTRYLRTRFAKDRVYLLGQSWGTLLGVLAAQREPQLYAAFIGSGQMVDPRQTDQLTYRDTLAWAKSRDDTPLVATLTANGEPPYTAALDYETLLSHEGEVYPYEHAGNAEGRGQMGEGIFVEEYGLLDKVHNFAGFLDTFPVLYPQLQQLDLRVSATRLEVPVYLFQGAHEASSRSLLADQWFSLLVAPHKERATAATSGHRALWEQPIQFDTFMTQTVLAQTQRTPLRS